MAALSGDILRFTSFQSLYGETILNVDFRQYFDVGGSGNTYQEIGDQYELAFRVPWVQYNPTGSEFVKVLVENMTNGIDFIEIPVGINGNRADPGLPTSNALSVKLNRTTKITRNGGKRLAGVTENAVQNNDVILQAGIITDIETFWGTTLSVTAGMTNDFDLSPVIVGRTKNPVTGIYELDLAKINPIQNAVVSSKISTQNTRKPLRGI